ncbi:Procollagen-lysine,2-oxoglutarate 5-dioxygenase 2 [Smittium culicis]|uniref:Procollagen-lysine,2-oxoglutarate 5-dioxygenase 2 n=1 Tax=Smittium culicis TaxID=133412 RepID=A0A1R1XQH3_9FUNG|nr:Procollagen-lysine,2-oxoglutarate 5-dioxygenase 2 [Smittium culicis]
MSDLELDDFSQNLFGNLTSDQQCELKNIRNEAFAKISSKLNSNHETTEFSHGKSNSNLSKSSSLVAQQRFTYLWSHQYSKITLRKGIPIYSERVFTDSICHSIISNTIEMAQKNIFLQKTEFSLCQESHLPKSSKEVIDAKINEQSQAVAENIHKDGWYSSRHSVFQTVDFPVDKLSPQVQNLIHSKLDSFVKTIISDKTGISPDFLIYRDLFIVKYSADSQKGLRLHSDGCLVSFNILLNSSEDFVGGGTYFEKFDSVFQGKQGFALIHDSTLMHSGVEISSGSRYILVGFVDTINS